MRLLLLDRRALTDGGRKGSAEAVCLNTARCQGSRERDCVAHVGEAGDVGEGALEAEAEAGVRYRAVAAQITPSPNPPPLAAGLSGEAGG